MSELDIPVALGALEEIIRKNDGFVTEEAGRIRQELNVPGVESLRAHLASLAEEQRLLTIGIIGRVKAGKSSLLNSVLFEGQDILPKAATPMTASLVIVSYGDEFSATVEYFTPDDISKIADDHMRYVSELEREVQRVTEELKKAEDAKKVNIPGKTSDSLEKKARKKVEQAFKEHRHFSAFDQFDRMKQGGKLQEMKGRSATEQRITAKDLDELKKVLGNYVGSDGVLMPFTKSVRVELPLESLRNIQVVDTPGINDPVVSREQRTQEYLKKCDVVLIVSPAGQFLSREDTDLMDKVTMREGVREMYVIASLADTQLYGDIHDKCGGDLRQAMLMLRHQLGEQAVSTLQTLKRNSPEVGDAYDQLIIGGEGRVIVTSSICHAMLLRFDQRATWDEGMDHAWGLLEHNYPDYFGSDSSARETLKLLANIESVQEGIGAARQAKDSIIEKKRVDYLAGQTKTLRDFRGRLVESVKARMDEVRNADLKTVQEQKKEAENLLSVGGDAVDGAYEDSLMDFQRELRDTVSDKSRVLFKEAKNDSKEAVKTETETKTGTRAREGVAGRIAAFFVGEKEYTYTEEVATVRSTRVKDRINTLVSDLQDELFRAVEDSKREWKKRVQREVVGELQRSVDDAGQFFSMLKKALRNSMSNMQLPEIEIDYPFGSERSGVLRGHEAEVFMEEVNSYLSELRERFKRQTTRFINDLVEAAGKEKLSSLIFSDLRHQLESLEESVKERKSALARLERCLADLDKSEI